jgi:hypothetical protein
MIRIELHLGRREATDSRCGTFASMDAARVALTDLCANARAHRVVWHTPSAATGGLMLHAMLDDGSLVDAVLVPAAN